MSRVTGRPLITKRTSEKVEWVNIIKSCLPLLTNCQLRYLWKMLTRKLGVYCTREFCKKKKFIFKDDKNHHTELTLWHQYLKHKKKQWHTVNTVLVGPCLYIYPLYRSRLSTPRSQSTNNHETPIFLGARFWNLLWRFSR